MPDDLLNREIRDESVYRAGRWGMDTCLSHSYELLYHNISNEYGSVLVDLAFVAGSTSINPRIGDSTSAMTVPTGGKVVS